MRWNPIWIMLLGLKLHAMSAVDNVDVAPDVDPPPYSLPADGLPVGQLVGNEWQGDAAVSTLFQCEPAEGECIDLMTVRPVGTLATGIQYYEEGERYDVYRSSVTGIGYVLGIQDFEDNRFKPVNQLQQELQLYPFPGSSRLSATRGVRARMRFITTGEQLQTGVTSTRSLPIAQISARNGRFTVLAPVVLHEMTIRVQPQGCSVVSGASEPVMLGKVWAGSLPEVGSVYGNGSATVSLSCDKGVVLHAVMTDQSQKGNLSDILNLTPDSTATGVGIQFVRDDGNVIRYGPDASAQGTLNQWRIEQAQYDQQILTVPLMARYIRTGPITAGSANGIASITFSYQ